MKLNDSVMEAVNSGVAPFALTFEQARFFTSKRLILRSHLMINSLEMGVLTPREYRYVARRGKRGDALTATHIEKLFEAYPRIAAEEPDLYLLTLPLYPKTLMSGAATAMLFEAFASHPSVPAERICAEVSADLLFEDAAVLTTRLKELRELGIRVAMFELGDEFCPLFRLAGLPLDLAFLLPSWAELPEGDEQGSAAESTVQFLHSLGIRVFSSETEEALTERARAIGFDGRCEAIAPEAPAPAAAEEPEVEDDAEQDSEGRVADGRQFSDAAEAEPE